MEQLEEAVRAYREDSGKTCDDIANELGIARTSFFNKMRGQFSFTLDEAYGLSRMLECTMDEFYAMTKA